MKALFAGIVIAAGIIVFLLLNQYFQQDEWHSFGIIQSYGIRYITLDKSIWDLLFINRVGARVIIYALFNVFGPSAFYFSLLALSLHAINSFLVFTIVKRVIKNGEIPLVAALFFFFNSLGHQAYSWFGTMAGSLTSVTFVLLSILFYFNFLEHRRFKLLFLSLFFIWVSFLFKESGYFIYILYPILWLIYTKKRNIKTFLAQNVPIFTYGLVMTVLLARSVLFIPGERANYIASSTSGLFNLVNNAFFYPFEGIGQSLLPSQFVFELARILTVYFVPGFTPETSEFDLFYTTKMAGGIVNLLSVLAIIVFAFCYRRYIKEVKSKRFFLFSVLFLYLSFIPYIVLNKFDAYLDSRYYYLGLAGASYIIAILSTQLYRSIKSSTGKKIIYVIFFSLFLSHVFYLTSDLFSLYKVSAERKSIVHQVLTFYPKLADKTVFYVTGNSPGYYGIPELKVPFQSGFGQVLMVLYGTKGEVDSDLFKEKTLAKTLDGGFLYDTLEQGYREMDRQGFGYFYDKETLKKQLDLGKFEKDDVVSLFYDYETKKIVRRDFN